MRKDSISSSDLAELLGVSPRTLRLWRRERRGPPRQMEGLEVRYPVTGLVPWLKKHRPDLADKATLARYRKARGDEREAKQEHDPWDEFCRDDELHRKRMRGYVTACKLDAQGKHEEADAVLRAAGVAAETVRERRSYLRRHQA